MYYILVLIKKEYSIISLIEDGVLFLFFDKNINSLYKANNIRELM